MTSLNSQAGFLLSENFTVRSAAKNHAAEVNPAFERLILSESFTVQSHSMIAGNSGQAGVNNNMIKLKIRLIASSKIHFFAPSNRYVGFRMMIKLGKLCQKILQFQ